MFLTSALDPSRSRPLGRRLMLASQRKLPSWRLAVDTSRYWRMECRVVRYSLASSGERMSGLLTTSINGTPERFTSTRL